MVPEARRVYRRIVTVPLLEPTPRQLAHRAWATFRLPARKEVPHPREEALELYRRAFEQATDPLFDDRFRALAVLQAGRDVGTPAPEVDELLDMTAEVKDRARARGILRSAEYACDLLLHDSAEGIDQECVDGLRRRLAATLDSMEGKSS
jgi:hypothetical protein